MYVCMYVCMYACMIGAGCTAYKVKHHACNHSKQEWVRAVQCGRLGTLLVHTGAIHAWWQQCNFYIPDNITTHKNGEMNADRPRCSI